MYAYKAKQRKQHICLALCHESDIMPSSHRPTRLDKTALSRLLLFLILNHLRFYWHCPHSMRSKVYATVGRPSVRPFVPSIDCSNVDRWVCCWVPRGQEISIDSCGRRLQALSSKCGQRRVESRRRRFNTDVFVMPSCSRSENTRRRPQYQKHVNIALSSRENRATATANFLKFGHVVPGICDQTDRHACTPIAKPIARTPAAAR